MNSHSEPTGSMRVLVGEDDASTRLMLVRTLTMEGCCAIEAADGRAVLDHIASDAIDVVLLDVGLPEIDGFSVLIRIRKQSDVPVILLTGRTEEADRVLGFELGADDYVTKPFFPRELAARVRNVATRRRSPSLAVASDGIDIDGEARELRVNDRLVELTNREFGLLAHLAANPRQVFTRGQLLQQVWESRDDWQDDATVTEHIRRIRLKLGSAGDKIITVRGAGYRFDP